MGTGPRYTTPFGLGDTAGAPGAQQRVSSARQFADAVAREDAELRRAQWGLLAPLRALFAKEDKRVRAARRGADGEDALARVLNELCRKDPEVRVLHDRVLPGRRENVDHLLITPAGVWAIDAKAYQGLIDTGGWWARARELRVGGRAQDKLIAQSLRQQASVLDVLAASGWGRVPVRGALCFVQGSWGRGAQGSAVRGVLVCSPRGLLQHLRQGPRQASEGVGVPVGEVTAVLDAAFRRATWT